MRAATYLFLAVAAIALAACGRSEEPVQKTGRYQGKPDTAAWDSPQFGGKQAEWERAIQTRTQNQNEYIRMQ